jgi:hypothetical protein
VFFFNRAPKTPPLILPSEKGEENSLVFIALICSLVKRSVITATIAISLERFYTTDKSI